MGGQSKIGRHEHFKQPPKPKRNFPVKTTRDLIPALTDARKEDRRVPEQNHPVKGVKGEKPPTEKQTI